MNKYQEAFERIKRVVVFNKNYRDYENDLKVIKELVDKETPMKPINTIRCANCGGNKVKEYLTDTYGDFEGILNYSYCGDCGQKLDWSMKND